MLQEAQGRWLLSTDEAVGSLTKGTAKEKAVAPFKYQLYAMHSVSVGAMCQVPEPILAPFVSKR